VTTQPQDFAQGIRLDDLWADPCPIYRRLHREAPVAWVPDANRYLIARQADIASAREAPGALQLPREGLTVLTPGHKKSAACMFPKVRA
jgi:hypothetical protein